MVALGARGFALAKRGVIGRVEYAGYAGIAASVAALWCVVVSGYSGLPMKNLAASVAGLVLLSVSGASITVSLLYCKRLQDSGVGADALTAVRYAVLILLAGTITFWNGRLGGAETGWQLAILLSATVMLIILPLYALQLGIGRTSPLTAQVIRALGPVFVFAMEQLDGRVRYSAPTLICILIYSASVVLSNFARGRHDKPEGDDLSESGDVDEIAVTAKLRKLRNCWETDVRVGRPRVTNPVVNLIPPPPRPLLPRFRRRVRRTVP